MTKSLESQIKKNRILGICLGASTITGVSIESSLDREPGSELLLPGSVKIIDYINLAHGGNPQKKLLSIFQKYNPDDFERIAVTGRRFRYSVNLSSISEPEAVEYAYQYAKPKDIKCPAIISAGGETFIVYLLNRNGRISNVVSGNKCASGTGEFFLQQLRRMDVTVDEAAQWSETEQFYAVSGRCSVFCKSDCTHAINKGIPKSRVTAGLCRMMANKILELLKKVEKRNIMIVGGSTKNPMMITYLQNEISGLIVPESASYFEALGAALWTVDHETKKFPGINALYDTNAISFDILPPLNHYENQVTFKSLTRQKPVTGDICILGLDVGSTTTKAVLVRKNDNAILASIYRLTSGDPVGASRSCYKSILNQIEEEVDPSAISIVGLGVCGSGRQIAGLHAMTTGIINEIIAHATAAVYFDPEVDTIFEIGGQDAKYTYITAGVPSDYAMNEACSAGTGSFLEESAYETLGIKLTEIADLARKGTRPPNFNDQCAAFISSDIKTAIHEGIDPKDIAAGLVYSICMNYNNRVKGNRPVGQKVFMQGGVCYNHAVPLAMAALTGKPIIVPPEPGLMGAFGVALEIKKRIELGIIKEQRFDLKQLAERNVEYGKSFYCNGGKEKCDRKCEISMILLDGNKVPFGGACNRYYNLQHDLKFDVANLDMIKTRENLLFKKFVDEDTSNIPIRGTIGINKSFLVNSFYPLYHTFFRAIGLKPLLTEKPSQEGIDWRNAPFCYPAELSHGFFHTMLTMDPPPDYIFLPFLQSIPVRNGYLFSQVCPFVQGESFYLQATFKKYLSELSKKGVKLLTPFISMKDEFSQAREPFIETALLTGATRSTAESAFDEALRTQHQCLKEMKKLGLQMLSKIESNPENIGVVILGRPYNAMVEEAHMGIPHKLATRGIQVIPFDFLPIEDEESYEHMYWGTGQLVLKAARFVERHPQLFGIYITNFSCGPDSFLITYFRSIMGRKPSLTLELDSHTADAGLETRIEAFLDIVTEYRQLTTQKIITKKPKTFIPAHTFLDNGTPKVKTSSGKILSVKDPRVTFLIPSMGRLSTEAIGAVFKDAGYHVAPHPPADENILKTGRANTSCKECMPLILTTGSLLNYVYTQKKPDEILVYFMPTTSGPCRFGQYAIFMKNLIHRLELPDVAMFTLTSDNTYFGMGEGFNYYKAWWAIIIADIMEDIRSMLLTNAINPKSAMNIFEDAWQAILYAIESGGFKNLIHLLSEKMRTLSQIPVKKSFHEIPKILLTGEIFVRRDSLSRRYLTEWFAEKGFSVICSPVSEWIRYSDYLVLNDENCKMESLPEKIRFYLRQLLMNHYEKRLTSIMSQSGLVQAGHAEINQIIDNASAFLSPKLSGEAILTIGSALTEIVTEVCGVIAIGPFGCMPNRLSESILSETMTRKTKLALNHSNGSLKKILSDTDDLPFMAIESDGAPFPQLITAKLETFCQSALRLHHKMLEHTS